MSQDSDTNASDEQAAESLPPSGQDALSALRNVWSAQGQGTHDVDESSCESNNNNEKQCKNTKHMGFEGIIDDVAATSDTDEAVDNVQTAWRKKLERDGKLSDEGKSIREMVLGSEADARQ